MTRRCARGDFTRIRFLTVHDSSGGPSPIRGVMVSHGNLRLHFPNDYNVIINPMTWALGVQTSMLQMKKLRSGGFKTCWSGQGSQSPALGRKAAPRGMCLTHGEEKRPSTQPITCPVTLPKGPLDEPPAPGPQKTPTAYAAHSQRPGGRTASLSPSLGTFSLMLRRRRRARRKPGPVSKSLH